MTGTAKIDFKKELDSYRAKSGEFRVLDAPRLQYLMVDGHGDPNTSTEFAKAVEALYPVAYAMKFGSKTELGRDYTVMPLEGLWWSDDLAAFTHARDKSQWSWTLLLMTPDWIDVHRFNAAVAKAGAKKPPEWLDRVRLEWLDEGTVVQTLHRGSFDDEGPTLARMHDEFIPANGLHMTGKHHEIYFSDFRKVPADKMRTILRQPVARLAS
ncbi:GyrI-like domain-containing protein [Pseudoclavibacter helvolus]|uniref:GyrI-like domain-containing protein n=1 Tax=Pseudoclavibacter helvolus TaxID=255205 RepID=UPI003C78A976